MKYIQLHEIYVFTFWHVFDTSLALRARMVGFCHRGHRTFVFFKFKKLDNSYDKNEDSLNLGSHES